MRTSIKILEEERHLTGEEAGILKRALRESRAEINTIRELQKAVQHEEKLNEEAEELVRNGESGRAAHHYKGIMGKTRIDIDHLITTLEGELTTLEHLIRDLHRVDALIGERIQRFESAVHEERRAA